MRATDIIMKKRGTKIRTEEGGQTLSGSTTLSAEEIAFLVKGYVDGTIPDYQISAFLTPIFFNSATKISFFSLRIYTLSRFRAHSLLARLYWS